MFCNNCGKEIPDDSKFCKECGAAKGTVVAESDINISLDSIESNIFDDFNLNGKIYSRDTFNRMIVNSDKIKSIKNIRELTGWGLAEAKYFVDDVIEYGLDKAVENKNNGKNDSKVQKGGCYIATAVYKSYDAPEVLVLRNFRDNVLEKSLIGRMFIKTYYFLSPPIANWLKNSRIINFYVKKLLDRVISSLQEQQKL